MKTFPPTFKLIHLEGVCSTGVDRFSTLVSMLDLLLLLLLLSSIGDDDEEFCFLPEVEGRQSSTDRFPAEGDGLFFELIIRF